jgi:hypothetical protein
LNLPEYLAKKKQEPVQEAEVVEVKK